MSGAVITLHEHERLVRSERRLRCMLEHGSDVISIHDAAGVMTYQSPSIKPVLGYEPEELVGRRLADYLHPDERERVLAEVAALQTAPGVHPPFYARFRHKDGSFLHFECVGTNLLDEPAVAGIMFNARDVTERVRVEEELRRSRDELAAILRTIRDGVIVTDASGKMIYANEAAAAIIGFDTAQALLEATPEEVFARFHVMDESRRPLSSQELPGALAYTTGGTLRREVRWLDRRTGAEGFSVIDATRVDDASGRPLYVVNSFHDVTERTRTQQARNDLAAIVEAVEDAIVAVAADGTVKSWNPGAERLYGYTSSEMVGRSFSLLVADEDAARRTHAKIVETVFAGERVPAVETTRRHRSGDAIPVSVTAAPIRDGAGAVIAAAEVAHDVRPRRQLEEQFRQAQKMEAIGRLAGGIAHDFNNVLSVILTSAELLREATSPDVREIADDIFDAGSRATSLTRQLLAFSRGQVLELRSLALNDVIQETEKMLRRLVGEDVVVQTDLAPDLARVRADAGQLVQVLLNLAVNARDAMPRGGTLRITTKRAPSPPASGEADRVLLSVGDDGVGMDAETKARAFDPFFTTKEVGKGTGLGLAMVYGVVKQSGGEIFVESAPGEGSRFDIYLPCASESTPRPRPREPEGAAVSGHGRTVLIVEDDGSVRRLAARLLTRAGFTVLEAPDGVEALAVAGRHPGTIDLLLADVVMPRASGVELWDQLVRARPSVRVLFMTGYTDDAVIRHGVPRVELLQKPFTVDSLLAKVGDVLREP